MFTAGDTYSVLVSEAAYPAGAGWVLKQRLTPRAAGGAAINLTAAAEGDSHRLAAAASITADWVAGDYTVARWVERAGEVFTVWSGQLSIAPNPRTLAVGTDTRTQARKALEQARAAFAAWLPTQRRFRIADREHEFNSTAEILRVVSYWETEVAKEEGTTTAAAMQGGRFYLRA